MTRGNQRELARAKNLKKQDQNKKKDDGLSAGARKERDADVMRQKQQAAAAKKDAAAAAGQASGGGGGKKWWKGSSSPWSRNDVDLQTAVDKTDLISLNGVFKRKRSLSIEKLWPTSGGEKNSE